MLIYSFGSDFVLETDDPDYLAAIASDIAYANSKGIEVGGYDLICEERGNGGYGGNVGNQWDTVDEDGTLGLDACFASGWADKMTDYALNFINVTGLSMLETDGPYGGAECSSTNHTHHVGFEDSVYMQTQMTGRFYTDLRSKNVFINQPDNYFYQGGQKTGMGYSEDQYSLPRWEDLSVSRQGMFDDTYYRTPTQGWMFVPLVDYHGGGDAAAFEPLSEHLQEYEWALAQVAPPHPPNPSTPQSLDPPNPSTPQPLNPSTPRPFDPFLNFHPQYLGYGTAACYRGTRLYDTDETKAVGQ